MSATHQRGVRAVQMQAQQERSLHYLYRRVRQQAWVRSSATQIRVGSSSSFFAVQSQIGGNYLAESSGCVAFEGLRRGRGKLTGLSYRHSGTEPASRPECIGGGN